jgi:hypothetical protein
MASHWSIDRETDEDFNYWHVKICNGLNSINLNLHENLVFSYDENSINFGDDDTVFSLISQEESNEYIIGVDIEGIYSFDMQISKELYDDIYKYIQNKQSKSHSYSSNPISASSENILERVEEPKHRKTKFKTFRKKRKCKQSL